MQIITRENLELLVTANKNLHAKSTNNNNLYYNTSFDRY